MKVKQLCEAIVEGKDGFSFGKPWRFSDESIVAILPILRTSDKERGYLTFVEAGDDLDIQEIGKVNEMIAKNNGSLPVFLKAGEVLQGSTQERAMVTSQIVLPNEERQIEVICIHQTRGLSRGATVTSGDYIPTPVYRRMKETVTVGDAAQSQGTMWSAVGSYTATLCNTMRSMAHSNDFVTPTAAFTQFDYARADNLSAKTAAFSQAIAEVLNRVPVLDNQVGLVTIGIPSVLALECYDLGDSWSAVREAAVKQHGEDLSQIVPEEERVFEYIAERAYGAAKSTLEEDYSVDTALEGKDWQSLSLDSDKFIGEATLLGDDVIHLMLVRKD